MPRRRLNRRWETALRAKARSWTRPDAPGSARRSPFPTPGPEYRKPRARGSLSRSSPPNRWGRGRDKDWHWPTPPSCGGTEERYGSTLNWARERHSTFASRLERQRKRKWANESYLSMTNQWCSRG